MQASPKKHPFLLFNVWFLVVFLILFPKGGIKFGSAPLTWAYFYLAISTPVLLIIRLTLLPLRFPLRLLLAIAAVLPIELLYVYGYIANGVVAWPPVMGMVLALFFMPFLFLFVFPEYLTFVDGVRLSRYFRWCILLAAMWGLLLFFTRPVIGHFIEIPYLTVNAGDYGNLEGTKHISRGAYFKLISTYNNGNLYGVATLILLPIYQTLERVRWRRWTVIAALMLTLARTVWAGLIIAEGLPLIVVILRQAKTFPVVYLGKATRQILALLVTVGLIFVALLFNSSSSLSFLLDPTAGGRTNELAGFTYVALLPTKPVGGFYEIAYAAAAEMLGWTGFAAFVLMMVSPLLLLLVDRSALRSPIRVAALHGLTIYAVIAWSDAAIVLIPVMAFYWFVYMIYLFGWPNEQAALAGKPVVEPGHEPQTFSVEIPEPAPSL